MKPADDIRRLFEDAELSTCPSTHERVFTDVLHAYQRTIADSPAQPAIGRLIMRHSSTKYAVAAVLVLAAIVGVSLFHRTGSITWAIEQSIEALSKYSAVIVEGWDSERTWWQDGSLEPRPAKRWAVANADQTMVEKYRHEVDGVPTLVTNGEKTWRYDSQANTVRIEDRPYIASECWFSRLLEQLRDSREGGVITQWEEARGKDPATGKQRVFLTVAWLDGRWNGPRSMWFEFDVESKLLIRFKQWENAGREGPATSGADSITYHESLPDALGESELPAGATVGEH